MPAASPMRVRFEKYVVRSTDGCWAWRGAKSPDGYGLLHGDNGEQRAHRIAWVLLRGSIPPGMFVLHHCDNPECSNPDHLYIGTQQDNVRDRERRGRRVSVRGEQHGRAKLTADQVRELRDTYRSGGHRQKDLASKYGISQTQVGTIVRGEQWRSAS